MRAFDHPLRKVLHEEIHARPPVSLWPFERLLSQSFLLDGESRKTQIQWIENLATNLRISNVGQTAPSFYILELRPAPQRVVIKWELHGEFSSISAVVQQSAGLLKAHADSRSELETEIEQLLKQLGCTPIHEAGGQRIAAIDIAYEDHDLVDDATEITHLFPGNTLLGSTILSSRRGQLWTDLQLNEDGYISFLVLQKGIGSRQAGRIARRIIEAETYRMAAMLAFPLAKSLSSPLRQAEGDLAKLSGEIAQTQHDLSVQTEQDGHFLAGLSQLASKTEQWISEHGLRFTAAEAYSQLVKKNLMELSESPIPGVQMLGEFMDRRFEPAMNTCIWTQKRLKNLSERISTTTQTLRARIEFVNEEQTQALLASMDKRAKMQLRLQETVEGLSVLVLTYYAVSLLAYMAKGGKHAGMDIEPEVVAAVAAPVIAIVLYLLNKLRSRQS